VDLFVISFDVFLDHVREGVAEIELTIRNQGSESAEAFTADIVYSRDEITGNSDDLVVGTIEIAQLGAGEEVEERIEIILPRDTLLTEAESEDAAGEEVGYISRNLDYLGLVIDPANAILEVDENNNFNRAQGLDKDHITYFPWDLDENGLVTPIDFVTVVNNLGGNNSAVDLNGDGVVTASDALAVGDRLGYARDEQVFADAIPVASVEISPRDGSERVSLTRETVVRFGEEIVADTVNEESFYLIANGERVPGEIRVSSTGEFVTFFYDEPLPASTEVRGVVDGDKITGINGLGVDGD